MADAYDLAKTFVHVGGDGATVPLEVTETFFQDLGSGTGSFGDLGPGRLLSLFAFEGPWDSWEVHPNGDEIVLLLSGRAEMTLEGPEGNRAVVLSDPGTFVLIPRGTWHTATTREPTRMLFLTDGEGTDHRPA